MNFDLEDIYIKTLLFDFYGELLNDHRNYVYGLLVTEDMSISEIALQLHVSRQAVFDLVKQSEKQLIKFEDKLHLVEKFVNMKDELEKSIELIDNNKLEKSKEIINNVINYL